MVAPVLIGVMIAIGTLMVIYFGTTVLLDAGNKYQDAFTRSAERNLSEMFVFIDPKKIYVVNLAAILFSFFICWALSGSIPIAIILALFLGSMPRHVWKVMRERRKRRFLVELPDAITSISTMMKAGNNLNMALEIIVSESKGPISQEFGVFLNELRLGVNYFDALDNLRDRMPIQELELVISGMKISKEIGGSLSDVLYRLADTIRRKIEMEGKIDALTGQGKAQGYVMTALPLLLAGVLLKLEPEAMGKLFTEIYGWATCAIFVIGLYIGYRFIKKIVNIDV